jgi:hypothetical protein
MTGKDIGVRCACGTIRGRVLGISPRHGCRLVCYCGDCQAFARFLGRSDITDEWGGTDIFQVAPSRLRLDRADTLACVRLSEKGMYRWYCGECKTPLGNTLAPKIPFIGLIHTCLDFGGDPGAREAALGKPAGYASGESAIGDLPAERRASPFRAIARSVRLLATWWLTRAGSPSPFFDEGTHAPRVAPRVLTADERLAL